MKLISPFFENGGIIPKKCGYKHGNISPPLEILDIPKETKSLVLIMDDPDAMGAVGKIWNHWILWNISPDTSVINENQIPVDSQPGLNDFDEIGYGGPAPPDKEHTYVFKLFAIDKNLTISKNISKNQLEKYIKSSILAESVLHGRFSPQ